MTITQLIYFQTVCLKESVTQAAYSLNVSQPALSNSIRDLEDEFGVDLFSRKSKRLILTKEGQYFLTKITPFIEEFCDLKDMMQSLGNARNNIKLGISPYASSAILPQIIDDFHAVHPEIEFEIHELIDTGIFDCIKKGVIDIGITNTNSFNPNNFNIYNIYQTKNFFCVNKNNPLAKYEEIDVKTIGQQKLVSLSPNYRTGKGLWHLFEDAGIKPNVILQTTQVYTMIEYINRDLAAGFLPAEVVASQPNIVKIPVKNLKPVPVGLVVSKSARIYADTAKFIQFIQSSIEKKSLSPRRNAWRYRTTSL